MNNCFDDGLQDSDFDEIIKVDESCIKSETPEAPNSQHLSVLSKFFGHEHFKPLQWEIISAIIEKKRDVCGIMATGFGKSLCFQFPAVYLNAVTFVISPLISLMEDQVLSLEVLFSGFKFNERAVNYVLGCQYSRLCTGNSPEELLECLKTNF